MNPRQFVDLESDEFWRDISERAVLEALYEATGGPNWDNRGHWGIALPLGEWHGVIVDDRGRVIWIDLNVNNLRGEIPVELGSLINLRGLHLSSNNLTGEIPRELGSLANLEYLVLGNNNLTGAIPVELATLANLQTLWLPNNRLTGAVPVQLAKLANLEDLTLNINSLTGAIPADLAKLANLETLHLSDNDLTGEIPVELGSLANLKSLNLSHNNLTGEIPVELGSLANLENLHLSSNNLTGEIPVQLAALADLEYLSLGFNNLTGEIPVDLATLANLQGLWLSSNGLTGEIPVELATLANLEDLFLTNNSLTGEIPVELAKLANLKYLDLSFNNLTGEIPVELGLLTNLEYLYLPNNSLTGAIPAELGGLESLHTIDVSKNPGMSGEMPASLTNLRLLEVLGAEDTELCAPSDPIFQDWLAGVSQRRVITCSIGDPPSFYLTQAVQSREFPVPLVSGEDALLRVFVTTTRATDESVPPVRARFFLNGAENYAVDIPGKSDPIPNVVKEGNLDASANAVIPGWVVQPGLKMVIDVDPEGTLVSTPGVRRRIPERGLWPVDVREMPLFELTVIPFQRSANPDSSILELVRAMAQDPDGHSMLWETRTLLPVRDLVVTAHPSVLTSSDNAHDLISETEAIRVMEGASGHFMGMMMSIDGPSGTAYEVGWSSFSIADASVIAHELGHNLGLRHPPGCGATSTDRSFPYPGGVIGAWGYDFRGNGGLVPPSSHDLMSYCRSQGREWISDYHFTNALELRLKTVAAGQSSLGARPARSLLLWGGVDAGGAPFLEPAFVVDAPPSLPRSTGEYEIIGRTANGAELFSLSFEMPQVAGGDGRSSFALALPVQPEWDDQLARITLSGPGGSVTLDGETNRPVTILRNPRNGQIRAILRDVTPTALIPGGTASTLSLDPAWERLTSRGIGGEALFLETPELIGQ